MKWIHKNFLKLYINPRTHIGSGVSYPQTTHPHPPSKPQQTQEIPSSVPSIQRDRSIPRYGAGGWIRAGIACRRYAISRRIR